MSSSTPTVQLNTGASVPILGLGTWKSEPHLLYEVVKTALKIGYRHLDCAWIYQNQKEVGKALKEFLEENPSVKREDIFITSKLWNSYHRPEDVLKNLEMTLQELQTPYLDLFLMHWPVSYQPGDVAFPRDSAGNVIEGDIHFTVPWKAMEELPKEKVKAIGLSNFNKKQVEEILQIAKIPPAMLQIELHPYLIQEELVSFCLEKGIQVTAYGPLGSPARTPEFRTTDEPFLMEDPVVQAIASKHGRSVAQVLIRFSIERGVIVIPKSVKEERLKSNFDSLNFKLTEEDMKQMRALGAHKSYRFLKAAYNNGKLKNYPFPEDL